MRTDKELLDFLDSLNSKSEYTGKCVLRMSATGRGWRLHETSDSWVSSSTAREAIENYMDKEIYK